jgi:hypothetical protein
MGLLEFFSLRRPNKNLTEDRHDGSLTPCSHCSLHKPSIRPLPDCDFGFAPFVYADFDSPAMTASAVFRPLSMAP